MTRLEENHNDTMRFGQNICSNMLEIPVVPPRPVTVYQEIKSTAQQRDYTRFLLANIPPTLKAEYKIAFQLRQIYCL